MEVFTILIDLQFALYGRYDVCCVDDSCACFQHGIECQIDDDCCQCGGTVVYYNHRCDVDEDTKGKKVKKRDSLSCANVNGNTLHCSVLDYVVDVEDKDKLKECSEHGIAIEVDKYASFLDFKSPIVQKYIDEW